MKKVLILTAGFGEGHNAAARNLRDALEHLSDEVKVEVLDLFALTYRTANTLVKKAYLGLVRYAPSIWGGIYSLLDHSPAVDKRLGAFTRLQNALSDILEQTQPDCVVSTYPVYAHVIREIYRDHRVRPFRFITVITDSITVNTTWFRAPSDLYCVPNDVTAEVLQAGGISPTQIKTTGFPVSHRLAIDPAPTLDAPGLQEPWRLLYIINTGKQKAGKTIHRLLKLPAVQLTVTVGRDAELKAVLLERTRPWKDRVNILGWTNQMPRLMQHHHLMITKAGGATVQEAIAACCPMIINQVIPGQEEGNARLVRQCGFGVVADRQREVPQLVEEAFRSHARQWRQWRDNLTRASKPDASLRLAELVLAECDWHDPEWKAVPLFETPPNGSQAAGGMGSGRSSQRALLCDFHAHTNYSDGALTIAELVDFYGQRGFDCLAVTDHLADPRRLIGKLARLSNLVLGENQLDEYFEVIERERRRAWHKYSLLLFTGLEFNKDGLTRKSSAHLLGIDLKAPIAGAINLPETIAHIHAQGGLAIASHPHLMKSEWGKNTLYLWENQDTFAPLIDAWEIANRNNIFTPVGLKNLPFVANSDFHKPKHIHSWKTILHCEKDPAAIKDCIRRNDHVSITMYREDLQLRHRLRELPGVEGQVIYFQPTLPLPAPVVRTLTGISGGSRDSTRPLSSRIAGGAS